MATVRLDQKRHALVRAVPDSYPKALARFFGSGPTDIAAARVQHQAYRQALIDNGVEVTVLPADHVFPDCIFVEDQAVPLGARPNRNPEMLLALDSGRPLQVCGDASCR